MKNLAEINGNTGDSDGVFEANDIHLKSSGTLILRLFRITNYKETMKSVNREWILNCPLWSEEDKKKSIGG